MLQHTKPTLAVTGAGPKALSIAAKAKVLRDLGIGDLRIIIFESVATAANWLGTIGLTTGNQMLGTSPEKDLGFPYQSIYGAEVNSRMLAYSWQAFLIDQRRYANWIDRGRPQPTHKQWAEYLRWVADQIDIEIHYETVVAIQPTLSGLEIRTNHDHSYECHGMVITGPGTPKMVEGTHIDNINVFNGRSYWQQIETFRSLSSGRVAVIGSGESAASIVISLLSLHDRESSRVDIDVITPSGTLFTRGEGFYENRLYSNPELWGDLALADRLEFIRRTDRGVISIEAQKIIAHASDQVCVLNGRVLKLDQGHSRVRVHIMQQGEERILHYDKVILVIGYDPVAQLQSLLPDDIQHEFAFDAAIRDIDYHLRLPIGKELEHRFNIHTPMLAALAQGPGFPNLSCLGVLSDRIISSYIKL